MKTKKERFSSGALSDGRVESYNSRRLTFGDILARRKRQTSYKGSPKLEVSGLEDRKRRLSGLPTRRPLPRVCRHGGPQRGPAVTITPQRTQTRRWRRLTDPPTVSVWGCATAKNDTRGGAGGVVWGADARRPDAD